jgi:hypothetical protein
LKPVAVLAVEGGAEEVERLANPAQRLLEGNPVPAFDDPVGGGADPQHETAPRGIGQGRGLLREQRRPALEDPDDAGAHPRPLGPGGAQGERREPVGPVRLAAPEVGVAGGLGPLDVLAMIGQGQPRQRQRQSPTLGHCATL